MKQLETTDDLENLGIYFIIDSEKNSKIVSEELIENGCNILLNKNNFPLYVSKRIEFLIKKDLIFYNKLRSAFISVIIENSISIFNSDELELILNGQPFIDLYDWRINSIYQGGINENSQVNLNLIEGRYMVLVSIIKLQSRGVSQILAILHWNF